MKKQIKNIIEIVYKNKNYNYFVEECKKNIDLPKAIIDAVTDIECQIIEFKETNEPAKRWCFIFKEFNKGNFQVSYKTILNICKITPLFYIQHEFSVKNIDTNCISQTLDGFDSQPYTIEQSLIYKKIAEELKKEGYIEMSYAEMNEVVCSVNEINNESIFGTQLTVENLIFHDFLDISELES